MNQKCHVRAATAVCVVLGCSLLVWAKQSTEHDEQERRVKESEVPAAALNALKQLAGTAVISEFEEETEHGHKFYEAEWKGPNGYMEATVTDTGDVVEVEEKVPADKVPAAVRSTMEKEAGKDATVKYEKITFTVYEAAFKKDGKVREIVVTPDGRLHHEEGKEDDEDNDEDDDDNDDDD